MSHYAKYLEEFTNQYIIEDENGYATYKFEDDYVYIMDIFVVKEKREKKIASSYADKIAEIAKQKGYYQMVGSTNLEELKTEEAKKRSMLVLLSYGFNPWFADKNILYYKKTLQEIKNV